MPIIEEMGAEHINIAIDMDAMENPDVDYHLKQLIIELKSKRYNANLVLWNPDDGKELMMY